VAVPTFAALFLGGALMSKKPFDPDPLGSHSIDPTPVFESLGCFAECQTNADCGSGLSCYEVFEGCGPWCWYTHNICGGDVCVSGLGCGSACSKDSQCAAGMGCLSGTCQGSVCGPLKPGCGTACNTVVGNGTFNLPNPNLCDPGLQCLGTYDYDTNKTNYSCWADTCYTNVFAGVCGDACGPDAPCGAELMCKPNDDGSGSSCWHPSCPDSDDIKNNPPAQNVNPNVNVPPPPTESSPETVCTCEGTTLICTDGTYAEFNPACGVGGDACGNSTCGDGTCNVACGEDINTCPADCHL